MARFSCNDIDGFLLDMEEIAQLPDDVTDDMLMAGAEEIRKAHVRSLNKHFDKHTAKLIGSPKVFLKRGTGDHHLSRQWSNSKSTSKYHEAGERYALVYPSGEHHKYRKKTHSYTDYNWGRAGKTKTTSEDGTATNNDLGFVHEFGGHGNEATGWMREANEDGADDMVKAEEKVYDAWIKSKKL